VKAVIFLKTAIFTLLSWLNPGSYPLRHVFRRSALVLQLISTGYVNITYSQKHNTIPLLVKTATVCGKHMASYTGCPRRKGQYSGR
jgi:hypothetical protein